MSSRTEEPWRRQAAPSKVDQDDNGGWRSAGSNNGGGGRPKLNLSKRGEAPKADAKSDSKEVDETADKLSNTEFKDEPSSANNNKEESGKETTEGRKPRRERGERKFREPEVVNSRAAMLGEAAAPRKEVCFVNILPCLCAVCPLCDWVVAMEFVWI